MKPRVPASKYKKFIEFVEFLKANGATTFFENNENTIIFRQQVSYWISGAFAWRASKEGFDFWQTRHDIWFELQREQNR